VNARSGNGEELLFAIAQGDLSGLQALVQRSTRRPEVSGLDAPAFEVAKIAALTAMNASPRSWVVYFDSQADKIEVESVVGTLISVAPIVGMPRVVSAATNIINAVGFVDEFGDEAP